jgi:hypothetical protein
VRVQFGVLVGVLFLWAKTLYCKQQSFQATQTKQWQLCCHLCSMAEIGLHVVGGQFL